MLSPQSILELIIGKRKAGLVVKTRYLLAIDCLSIMIVFWLSQLIRHESFSAAFELLRTHWPLLVFIFILRIGWNSAFGLYYRLWRYASVLEVLQVLKSSLAAFLTLGLVNFVAFPLLRWPSINSFSFLVLDGLLNLVFLTGSRFGLRLGINWLATHNKQALGRLSPHRRILTMGAGDSGSLMIRLMQENPELGFVPLGIMDDNPAKQSLRIHGIPVLGKRIDIPKVVKEQKIDEVIIAMPSAPQQEIEAVCRICSQANVPVRVAPDLRHLLGGQLTVDDLRQWRRSEFANPAPRFDPKDKLHNILVTGGAGFIGSNFVRYMLAKYPDYRVVVYDKLTYAGNLDNLHGLKQAYGNQYLFVRGDICDNEQISEVMGNCKIDSIINFAAETHVDRSLVAPDAFIQTNVIGTYFLLEAAKKFNVSRYHQVSSDEVYGQVMHGSFGEDDPLQARSPYSASKASADLIILAYFNSFGVPATITRGSNTIGPYQYLEKAVPLFITNALEDKALPLYGDGLYIRDYQYVLDHCRGIDLVLHHGLPGEVYNLGSGHEIEALTLAKMILDRLEKPYSLIQLVSDRQGQDRRYSLNCAKIKALGWSPQWSFEKSLDATIKWYVENDWWWRKLKAGEYKDYYEMQYRKRLNDVAEWVLTD